MRHLSPFRRNTNDQWMQEFDRFFDDAFAGTRTTNAIAHQPRVDIEEVEDGFLISADLPGVNEKDISIEVKDRILRIHGERSSEKKEQKDGQFKRYERTFGRFERSFQLPENINDKDIKAHYENGVLEVLVPRAEVTKAKSIKVESGKGGLFANFLGKSEHKDVN